MPAGTADAPPGTARRFMVVWQDPQTRAFVRVGTLEATEEDEFRFWYDQDAVLHPRFRGFRAFPDLDREYRSARLFPFVANRIMSARRPDYGSYVEALGLTAATATPMELLARSAGGRLTDTIQIVPEPTVEPDGTQTLLFLVSGVRHIEDADARIASLAAEQELHIRPEPDNDYNPRALLLDTRSGESVGWVPDYLLDYVHKSVEDGRHVRVFVQRANGPEAPWHLRLLCRMEVRSARGA